MYPIKQSTALTVPFFVHNASGDAVTGLTDGSFTKRISKNGAAFGAMTVTISEMENGWYSIPLSTSHSDTTGLLSITFTNAGAKQVNLQFRVHANLPDEIYSDTAVIETKTSDTHSRLVVVEAAIDSDQTSRATAISDVKSELVIVSAAVATLDAAVDSDQTSRTAAISDVKSRLVVVEGSIDSDQTSRATAISDVKSELVIISGAVATLDAAVDSDQTSRATAISDVKSALTVAASDAAVLEGAVVLQSGTADSGGTTSFVDAALTEADNYWNGCWVQFTSGTLAGQVRLVTGFTAATDTVTFAPATTVAVSTHTYNFLSAAGFIPLVSDAAAIEVTASDTHSRLVVVEAAVDSDQVSRAAAISDTKSRLVVVEAAVDSDQVSRTSAISDVKSELVIVSAAVATVDAAIDSDQLSRATAISDVKSRLVVVESAIDSDQTSRTTAISDVKSQLTLAEAVTTALGAAAAAQLNKSANQIISFTVDTVTNGHTPTTTEFQADDITEATPDHYNGRIVIFTSGVLAGQATDITDYAAVGGIGQFTVTALTEAPANNDTGIIL